MANLLGKHRVHWNYDNNSNKKTTICRIENESREVISEGVASLFHKDTYDKKVARSLTFRRAMQKVAQENLLPKEVRAEVWNDFRQNINQPETI